MKKEMKTLNLKMVFMMALAVCTTAFTSCSSDDEDGSEDVGATSKHIVKSTLSDGYDIETTTFDYDSQGRVVKMICVDTDGYREYSSTTTYTYGESTIISKTQGDIGDGTSCTYSLSAGKITKEVTSWKNRDESNAYYTYDSNGYLASRIHTGGYDSEKTEFTWTNGNLTKISTNVSGPNNYSFSYTYTISYSDILWPQNYMHYWKPLGMDKVLEPLGVWGKMPKYLPKKIVHVDEDGKIGKEETIEYTIENGEITKVTYYESGDDSYPAITTFEWQ